MAGQKKKISKIERIDTVAEAAYKKDYSEIPVQIGTFLSHPTYLGKITEGGKSVFPFWRRVLSDIAIDDTRYVQVFTGAIGIGKTCTAIAAICYGMYRVLCLKDPWKYFEKIGGGKIAIIFFNLTKSISHGKGFNLLQSYLLSSPWFRAHGTVTEGPSIKNPRIDFPIFDYISGSPYAKGFGFVSQDVLFAIMDEVDDENESIKQKMKVLQAYETTVARFESRFVRVGEASKKGETLGRFFLCASKQEKLSFLNTFIVKMHNSPIVNIVDAPLWEVRVDLNFSGVKFPIMLGDLYTPSKILGDLAVSGNIASGFEIDRAEMALAEKQGFEITWVPIELLERFQKDIVGNLRRLAGISVNQLRKSKLFPSEKLLVDCYDPVKKDPVSMLTIECGQADELDLCQYVDFDKIRVPRHVPRYIHVDIAYAGGGDALGIGMSCISGWSDRTVEELLDSGGEMRVEKLPIVETDFGMRVKARLNDKIPLPKIRKFIGDLNIRYGFNIKLVTYDYDALSEESKQILTRFGIKCANQSLDKSPYKYRSFRNLCGEKRWCCHRNDYLHFELVNLEDDTDKNKVDHPDEVVNVEILEDGSTEQIVLKGSKDMADGVVGSVMSALEDSGAPAPREFIDLVKEIISKPKVVDPGHHLVQIDRKYPQKPKEDTSLRGPNHTKFKDIFNKAQGWSGKSGV